MLVLRMILEYNLIWFHMFLSVAIQLEVLRYRCAQSFFFFFFFCKGLMIGAE